MLRILVIPLLLVFLLVRGVAWLLFVPLGRLLLKVSGALGPLRLPFLLLCSPIVIPCVLLDRTTSGRVLEGDVIRPTFSLPFAFTRGPWRVCDEQTTRSAELELVEGDLRSTLSITVSGTLAEICKADDVAARMVAKSAGDPPLANGMRWAGIRMTTFLPDAPLTCMYLVWKEDEPNTRCINVAFTGPAAHEQAADDFVRSALPALPEPSPEEAAPAEAGA